MNCGADDFIPKPFNPQILLAHVEAVLKRAYRKPQEGEEVDCDSFSFKCVKRCGAKSGKRRLSYEKLKTGFYIVLERTGERLCPEMI